MPDIDSTATSGVEVRGYRRGGAATDGWDQYVIPTSDRVVSFRGRAGSFLQLGIAGTTGQVLGTIFNAAGSAVLVDVESITMDVFQTAARVVAPPVVRLQRLTAAATGGTAMTKMADDSALTTSASVALLQGTASDGGAATAITATPATGTMYQEVVPRALTLVGYEQSDMIELDDGGPITLRASEGLRVFLHYTVATSNPVTDNYVLNFRWVEYTRP